MHVGPAFSRRRDPVDGAGDFAVDQDDALIALAHVLQVGLDDDRLAEHLGEHLQQRIQVLVARRDVEHARPAVAVQRLDDDVLVFFPKGQDVLAVGRDQGRRHELGEAGDEQFLRRVAHLGRVVHHQGLGMNHLQQMRRRDIGHVEGRVLAHQDDVRVGQIDARFRAQGEMVAGLAPHLHGFGPGGHPAVVVGEVPRQIMQQLVAAALRLQRQNEGAVAGDVDGRHMVHLNGHGKRHGKILILRPIGGACSRGRPVNLTWPAIPATARTPHSRFPRRGRA